MEGVDTVDTGRATAGMLSKPQSFTAAALLKAQAGCSQAAAA